MVLTEGVAESVADNDGVIVEVAVMDTCRPRVSLLPPGLGQESTRDVGEN